MTGEAGVFAVARDAGARTATRLDGMHVLGRAAKGRGGPARGVKAPGLRRIERADGGATGQGVVAGQTEALVTGQAKGGRAMTACAVGLVATGFDGVPRKIIAAVQIHGLDHAGVTAQAAALRVTALAVGAIGLRGLLMAQEKGRCVGVAPLLARGNERTGWEAGDERPIGLRRVTGDTAGAGLSPRQTAVGGGSIGVAAQTHAHGRQVDTAGEIDLGKVAVTGGTVDALIGVHAVVELELGRRHLHAGYVGDQTRCSLAGKAQVAGATGGRWPGV